MDGTIVFLEQRDNRISLLVRFTKHRHLPFTHPDYFIFLNLRMHPIYSDLSRKSLVKSGYRVSLDYGNFRVEEDIHQLFIFIKLLEGFFC